MKKWAVVVVILYGISLILLTVPVLFAAFWDPGGKNGTGFDRNALLSVYAHWPYWMGVLVLVLSQAALLIIPVRTTLKRPVGKRTVWLTVITAAFLMAVLAGSFVMTITEVIRGKEFANENIWFFVSCGVLFVTWIFWAIVFHGWGKVGEPRKFLDSVCRWLFYGSILELLIAVPTHIVVRCRNYCCAGIGTFCGITAGIAVMLLSFGPGVFFLFVQRWKRLRPNN